MPASAHHLLPRLLTCFHSAHDLPILALRLPDLPPPPPPPRAPLPPPPPGLSQVLSQASAVSPSAAASRAPSGPVAGSGQGAACSGAVASPAHGPKPLTLSEMALQISAGLDEPTLNGAVHQSLEGLRPQPLSGVDQKAALTLTVKGLGVEPLSEDTEDTAIRKTLNDQKPGAPAQEPAQASGSPALACPVTPDKKEEKGCAAGAEPRHTAGLLKAAPGDGACSASGNGGVREEQLWSAGGLDGRRSIGGCVAEAQGRCTGVQDEQQGTQRCTAGVPDGGRCAGSCVAEAPGRHSGNGTPVGADCAAAPALALDPPGLPGCSRVAAEGEPGAALPPDQALSGAQAPCGARLAPGSPVQQRACDGALPECPQSTPIRQLAAADSPCRATRGSLSHAPTGSDPLGPELRPGRGDSCACRPLELTGRQSLRARLRAPEAPRALGRLGAESRLGSGRLAQQGGAAQRPATRSGGATAAGGRVEVRLTAATQFAERSTSAAAAAHAPEAAASTVPRQDRGCSALPRRSLTPSPAAAAVAGPAAAAKARSCSAGGSPAAQERLTARGCGRAVAIAAAGVPSPAVAPRPGGGSGIVTLSLVTPEAALGATGAARRGRGGSSRGRGAFRQMFARTAFGAALQQPAAGESAHTRSGDVHAVTPLRSAAACLPLAGDTAPARPSKRARKSPGCPEELVRSSPVTAAQAAGAARPGRCTDPDPTGRAPGRAVGQQLAEVCEAARPGANPTGRVRASAASQQAHRSVPSTQAPPRAAGAKREAADAGEDGPAQPQAAGVKREAGDAGKAGTARTAAGTAASMETTSGGDAPMSVSAACVPRVESAAAAAPAVHEPALLPLAGASSGGAAPGARARPVPKADTAAAPAAASPALPSARAPCGVAMAISAHAAAAAMGPPMAPSAVSALTGAVPPAVESAAAAGVASDKSWAAPPGSAITSAAAPAAALAVGACAAPGAGGGAQACAGSVKPAEGSGAAEGGPKRAAQQAQGAAEPPTAGGAAMACIASRPPARGTGGSGCSNGAGSEAQLRLVLLVPCRPAMRGRFPLNGTYFQVPTLTLSLFIHYLVFVLEGC